MFKMIAPPEMWTDDDDVFGGLTTRRAAFELAMRRAVENEPGVEIICPAEVDGLLYEATTAWLHTARVGRRGMTRPKNRTSSHPVIASTPMQAWRRRCGRLTPRTKL